MGELILKFIKIFIVNTFIFSLLYIPEVTAQDPETDLRLIIDKEIVTMDEHVHDVTFGISKKKSIIVRYNPVTLTMSCLMYSYQKWLSPQISSNCYYKPSCSRYSKLLFQEYGFVKGLICSADRLMRCDRISATTFHPISIDPVDHKIHESVNRYRFKTIKPEDK